jgi:hypothetical protein
MAELDRLVGAGVLCSEPLPRLFLYRISRDGRRQIGVIGTMDLADLGDEAVAGTGTPWCEPAVVMVAESDGVVADLAARDMNERPVFHFNAGDGTTHSAWAIHDAGSYEAALRSLPVLRLQSPGASAGRGRVLVMLVPDPGTCEPFPPPRCGLFVRRPSASSGPDRENSA